jgi:ribonuclease HII
MNYATYELEDEVKELGYNCIAGVDEAGRGAGAGPVVAAAVVIPDDAISDLLGKVRDSKKLSYSRRSILYETIIECCDYGIGIIENDVIDKYNILKATKFAMVNALNRLDVYDYALIDGTVRLEIHESQKQIIKGDSLSISIAAASIIAKVTRDEIMIALHNKYPAYGWDNNKAYLTKQHIDAIKKFGITEYHRKSFRKVGYDLTDP